MEILVRFSLLTICFLCLNLSLETAKAEIAKKTIGVVDVQKVIQESKAGERAFNGLKKEFEGRRKELKEDQRRLEVEREQIMKQSQILSASALEDKLTSFEKKEKELVRKQRDLQEELTRKNNVLVGELVDEIEVILEELVSAGKYAFILNRDTRFVVFAAESVDASEEVRESLDRRT